MGLLNWLKSLAEKYPPKDAKQAKKELRQRRKELVAAWRQNAIVQRAVRAKYTSTVRRDSWMMSRDSWDELRRRLAKTLDPLERERTRIDCEIHGIDVALARLG